jgi:gas vesicle protein
MGKGKKFGLGIIVGAIAGVAAGFLTAPKSGKETRQDLKNKAQEARGSAERKLKEAHKELEKLSDEAKSKAKDLQGKAKEEMDTYAKKADELKVRVKGAITSIKSGDDDNDEATIDQLLSDLIALKKKVVSKAKSVVK